MSGSSTPHSRPRASRFDDDRDPDVDLGALVRDVDAREEQARRAAERPSDRGDPSALSTERQERVDHDAATAELATDDAATVEVASAVSDASGARGQASLRLTPPGDERSVREDQVISRSVTSVYGEPAVRQDAGAPARRLARGGGRSRRSWWRRPRSWFLILAALVGLGAAYFALTLAQVVMAGRGDDARPSDAIVVLGAAQYDGTPSPQLAARLDHASDLYERGIAPLVVVTGGKQPADRFTEAEASRAYLLDLGVPDEAILLENEGGTTYESLTRTADMLRERGSSQVVVVTDPYHVLRSRMTAAEVGLDAVGSATPSSVVSGRASVERHLQEAAGVAVGRIIGFERLSGR